MVMAIITKVVGVVLENEIMNIYISNLPIWTD